MQSEPFCSYSFSGLSLNDTNSSLIFHYPVIPVFYTATATNFSLSAHVIATIRPILLKGLSVDVILYSIFYLQM
jgi:hypothetical protein